MRELRLAQEKHTAAASKVSGLEAEIAAAREKANDHARLLEQVDKLKAEVASTGAAAIASGVALGDSSDWKTARKSLAAAQEKLTDSEATAAAYTARIDSLSDQLHDAKNHVKEAARALTEAQHDEACANEAKAAAAFLAAGDEFYRQHCELAEAIDKRIRLRNKITGQPAHVGGGYPVDVLLPAPGGASFTRDQLMRYAPPTAGATKGRAA